MSVRVQLACMPNASLINKPCCDLAQLFALLALAPLPYCRFTCQIKDELQRLTSEQMHSLVGMDLPGKALIFVKAELSCNVFCFAGGATLKFLRSVQQGKAVCHHIYISQAKVNTIPDEVLKSTPTSMEFFSGGKRSFHKG